MSACRFCGNLLLLYCNLRCDSISHKGPLVCCVERSCCALCFIMSVRGCASVRQHCTVGPGRQSCSCSYRNVLSLLHCSHCCLWSCCYRQCDMPASTPCNTYSPSHTTTLKWSFAPVCVVVMHCAPPFTFFGSLGVTLLACMQTIYLRTLKPSQTPSLHKRLPTTRRRRTCSHLIAGTYLPAVRFDVMAQQSQLRAQHKVPAGVASSPLPQRAQAQCLRHVQHGSN